MTNDKDGRKPVQYMTGRLYLVGKRKMKLWSIYRPCKWRDRACGKVCPGQLRFKGVKRLYCGYMGDMTPVYRRITRHKGNTAHISKGVR